MSTNQSHGKLFEASVLRALAWPEIVGDTIFDIPLVVTAKCAGSIKTAACDTRDGTLDAVLCLSDACRVWAWRDLLNALAPECTDPPRIRIIAGLYVQDDLVKSVRSISDITLVLDERTARDLYGTVTLNDVYAFHSGLRKEFFPEAADARTWAKSTKAKLADRTGCIQLNQKIDSKNQRRLQCSVRLSDLKIIAEHAVEETSIFSGIQLPLELSGGSRQRNRAKE